MSIHAEIINNIELRRKISVKEPQFSTETFHDRENGPCRTRAYREKQVNAVVMLEGNVNDVNGDVGQEGMMKLKME